MVYKVLSSRNRDDGFQERRDTASVGIISNVEVCPGEVGLKLAYIG